MQDQGKTRNRAPCETCKASKRKCDRTRSRCSRCKKRNLNCIPSTTAEWRVEISDSPKQRTRQGAVFRAHPEPTIQAGNEGNDAATKSSLDISSTALPGEVASHLGIAPEAPLHASDTIDYSNIDAIELLDPLCLDNLWIPPSLVSHGQSNSTWPLQEDDILEHFNPPIADNPMDPRVPILHSAISSLWNCFVDRIAPGISIDFSQSDNLRRLLAAEAANSPPLFSALVVFSQSVQANWASTSDPPANSTDLAAAARKMEQETILHMRQFVGDENPSLPKEKSQILDLLSTLVALCSSYIAREDFASLTLYLECALTTIRNGFSTELALDETFLFLVRWLGYIHTVAMLGETTYTINAPDYLSIASGRSVDASGRNMFFQDVDPFLGISQTVADLLYRLGRLLSSPVEAQTHSSYLEVEKTSVKIRLHLLLRRLERTKQEGGIQNDLDHYNESLINTCLLIFLTRLEDEGGQSGIVRSSVDRILESCAAVQETASVAKLMLFPLFTAGIHAESLVHRAFIRRRLEVIQSGYCIVNVKNTSEILDERWRSPGRLSMRKQASVCNLF